jgi:hypothetical protein
MGKCLMVATLLLAFAGPVNAEDLPREFQGRWGALCAPGSGGCMLPADTIQHLDVVEIVYEIDYTGTTQTTVTNAVDKITYPLTNIHREDKVYAYTKLWPDGKSVEGKREVSTSTLFLEHVGGRAFLRDGNVVHCRLADGIPWKCQ